MKKIKILYVCLGNICRSPVAEASMLHLVNKRGLAEKFQIESRGTASYHVGLSADRRSQLVAKKFGIKLESRASQIQLDDVYHFDYIFTMDKQNYQDIFTIIQNSTNASQFNKKIFLFREFDPIIQLNDNKKPSLTPDVPDPYYGDTSEFINVQKIILRTCEYFLGTLQLKEKIL